MKKKTDFYLLKQKSISEGDLFVTDYIKTKQRLKRIENQLEIIENENMEFIHPNDFGKKISQDKQDRKVLLTIDDGLLSFYQNAWPILRDKKIPFILFVNTREVGAFNYMTWSIKLTTFFSFCCCKLS